MSKWTGLRRLSYNSRGRVGGAGGGAATPSEQLLAEAQSKGWFALDDPTNPFTRTLRNDGSNDYFSAIADGLGNLPDLAQGTAANQPQLSVGAFGQLDGAVGDGVQTGMATSLFTAISQPYTILILCKSATTAHSGRPVRGSSDGSSDSGFFLQHADQGNWRYWGGSSFVDDGPVDTNINVWSLLMNGASSSLRKNGTEVAAGNPGSTDFVNIDYLARLTGAQNQYFEGIGGVGAVRKDVNLSPVQSMEDLVAEFAGL